MAMKRPASAEAAAKKRPRSTRAAGATVAAASPACTTTTLCTPTQAQRLLAVPSATAAQALYEGVRLGGSTLGVLCGALLPAVGFGTYKLKKGEALGPVRQALELGYRLVDTAQIYGNEGDVGQALKLSGVPRENVVIETKVWRSSHGFERTLEACRHSLRRLGVSHIDLYLIHWPGCKTGWPLPRGTKSPKDWTPAMRDEGTWRAMEQLHDQGKVRALGVSNYSVRHLQQLLSTCRIRPSVNQVEFHPWLVQSELLRFCQQEGIILQAYASLGSGDVSCRADFFSIPAVRAAAKAHDKTSAQVLIRWALDKGIHVIPKSKSTERMVENYDVFNFRLSEQEIRSIDECHRGTRFAWKHLDPDTIE